MTLTPGEKLNQQMDAVIAKRKAKAEARPSNSQEASTSSYSEDIVEKLNREHLDRIKKFENSVALNKPRSFVFPKWALEKALPKHQVENLRWLLQHCPPAIDGERIEDILRSADPANDYIQLRDPELLKLFASLLKKRGIATLK